MYSLRMINDSFFPGVGGSIVVRLFRNGSAAEQLVLFPEPASSLSVARDRVQALELALWEFLDVGYSVEWPATADSEIFREELRAARVVYTELFFDQPVGTFQAPGTFVRAMAAARRL